MTSPNLMDEAHALILKEEKEKLRSQKGKLSKFIEKEIIKNFIINTEKYPNVIELISTARGLSPLAIYCSNETDFKVEFFELNIGSEDVSLMQYETPASRDHGAIIETMYCAWAIRFTNIFGYDIYFIPYLDFNKGFACTLLNQEVDEELGGKHFFPQDISRVLAIEIIADHLRSKDE
jgi:hypothetical protein